MVNQLYYNFKIEVLVMTPTAFLINLRAVG